MRNKNVIIVGGTDGIGRTLAKVLVKDNRVLIIGRSEQKGQSFVRQHGENARFQSTDLSLLNNIPPLVSAVKSIFDQVDYIVHTADILRAKRINTAEGLEKCIATNYYSRVLFNQLILGETPAFHPERIIHIAAAGFPASKTFLKNFPLPADATSFKGHGIGQVSNDFYALGMRPKLAALGVKLTVLNPGMVDTDIRRNGQYPAFMKLLVPIIGRLFMGKTRSPEEYARIPLGILNNENPDADDFTLINSKARGISGNTHVTNSTTQQALYNLTKEEIDKTLEVAEIKNWL